MNITLRPEIEKRIDYEEGEMDLAEFGETKAAVDEALEQADRGEGISLEEFEKQMRSKYGIQR